MNDGPDRDTLQLERLALGELSPRQQAALVARLGDGIEPRLAALRSSNAEILAEHPPARVRAEVERRMLRAPARRGTTLLWLASPLAAAAVAALVLWPDPPIDEDPVVASLGPTFATTIGEPGETRAKGLEPHLVLHRQEGERAVPLAPDSTARPHDRLQISYVAAGDAHGVVLSIDGAGLVTLHHPTSADASTRLTQDGAVPLDRSYELDAAPDFERFILVTSNSPLDPAQVLAAAHRLAGTAAAASDPLPLPSPLRQRSFLLRKVAP